MQERAQIAFTNFLAGDLTASLFESLKGPMQTAIEVLGRVKEFVGGLSDGWKTFLTIAGGTAAVLGPILLAVGWLAPALLSVAGGISTVVGWVTAAGGLSGALSLVAGLLTGPVGIAAAIATVVAAIAWFLSENEITSAALVESWNMISSGVSDVVAALGDIFSDALKAWGVLWAEYGDEVTWFAKEFARLALNDIAGAIKTLASLVKATLEVVAGTIKVQQAMGDYEKGFGPGFRNVFDTLNQAISALPKSATGSGIAETGRSLSASNIFSDAVDRFVSGLDKAPRGTTQGATVHYTEGDVSITIQGANKTPQEIAEEVVEALRFDRRGTLTELNRLLESAGTSVATA